MQTNVLDHLVETPTVTSFKFAKPPGFLYQPGQFINVELNIEQCDTRCNKRNFSLTSSPTYDFLMIATRHGVSRFKQTTEMISKGAKINFPGPFGRFTLNEDERVGAVMLSGGIGITPLHSMIKYATYKKLTKSITLIYSNSVSDDIPFKSELDEFAKLDKYFTANFTITDESDTHWTGRVGRINENMVREIVPNWQACEFYVCGPASMVIAMKKFLVDMGVGVENLKSELFTGY